MKQLTKIHPDIENDSMLNYIQKIRKEIKEVFQEKNEGDRNNEL